LLTVLPMFSLCCSQASPSFSFAFVLPFCTLLPYNTCSI
jgi:hypothetical protein